MAKDCKQAWWKEAKYGMFIHWGLYSRLGGEWNGQKTDGIGEWIMRFLKIPVSEYEKVAESFNPVKFNAEEWVKLAQNAGMKYIVITAKHHDGFAMYRSGCSPYNIVDATPFGRDPIEELSVACRAAGIKLCFYYSQAQDWHDPNGYGSGGVPDARKQFDVYLEHKCKPQLRELLTQYGDIGLIWFDTPMEMSESHSREIAQFVKSIQPNCIVSGRIGNEYGEYMSTGDNMIPALPYPGDWEVPATLNETWGFKYDDHHWKSPRQIIELMVKINSRGGNYLLNVGPDGEGVIPEASQEILRTVGSWLGKYGDSIYGTQAMPVFPYEQSWGMFTYKPGKLFMHILNWADNLVIHCLANEITKMYVLGSGEEVEYKQLYVTSLKQHRTRIKLPAVQPDEIDSVICLELKEDRILVDTLDTL